MPKDSARPAAVIYARVSHAKQVAEGHGIDSQTTRCREFAARRGYDVVSVFTDDMTGRVDKRPGMEAMLRFVKKQKGSTVVLIDDISRLARDVRTHWNLRDELTNVGAVLESPTIEFGESPDDQLVENMLASVSQHFSQKNGEVTFNRMRSR
uniref:recombinase family protein n=1 Tax=Gilvibacter sp. TaxID=2729997 RepID=UPI0035BE6E67